MIPPQDFFREHHLGGLTAIRGRFSRSTLRAGPTRNAARVIETFVNGLDPGGLGFSGVDPQVTAAQQESKFVTLDLI